MKAFTILALIIIAVFFVGAFMIPGPKMPAAAVVASSEICTPLKDYIEQTFAHVIHMNAEHLDMQFSEIASETAIVAEVAKDIFENPEEYLNEYNNAQIKRKGEYIFTEESFNAHYHVASETAEIPADVLQSIKLTDHLAPVLRGFYNNNPNIIHTEILLANGLIRIYPSESHDQELFLTRVIEMNDARFKLMPEGFDSETALNPAEQKAVKKDMEKGMWTLPVKDVEGEWEISFVKKFSAKEKEIGTIIADIDLEQLQKMLSSSLITASSYAFLMTKEGTPIVLPEIAAKEFKMELQGEVCCPDSSPQLAKIIKKILENPKGIAFADIEGSAKVIGWKQLESNNWYYVLVTPIDELNPRTLKGMGITGLAALSDFGQ